ncbi:MAG: alpha/beta hydrolase [Mycobacteriaceae bacterium]
MTESAVTHVERKEIEFASAGTTIRAWLYPAVNASLANKSGVPAVVLAHGFSLTKDCGLQLYAETFARAGISSVVFDYRGWGDSDGNPRDVVNVRAQLADYHAAVAATRKLPGIDPQRIALWGTSYSGGTVIACAAEDQHIAAVVAQVPNLDNFATARFLMTRIPLRRGVQLGISLARDVLAGWSGKDPVYVTSVGKPGEHAAYISAESYEQLSTIVGPHWKNRVGLRDFVRFPWLRPVNYLDKLPCRIQLHACELDDLTPARPVFQAAKKLGAQAELERYEEGHFGIYIGQSLVKALNTQTLFLVKELTR